MLTTSQRERILAHLQHGWKLPDSLVHELWEAYETLAQALGEGGDRPQLGRPTAQGQAPPALAAREPHETRR